MAAWGELLLDQPLNVCRNAPESKGTAAGDRHPQYMHFGQVVPPAIGHVPADAPGDRWSNLSQAGYGDDPAAAIENLAQSYFRGDLVSGTGPPRDRKHLLDRGTMNLSQRLAAYQRPAAYVLAAMDAEPAAE